VLSKAEAVIVIFCLVLQRSVHEDVLPQVVLEYGVPKVQPHWKEAVFDGTEVTSHVFGSHVSAMVELRADARVGIAIPNIPAQTSTPTTNAERNPDLNFIRTSLLIWLVKWPSRSLAKTEYSMRILKCSTLS
jgi:hypothetical protein